MPEALDYNLRLLRGKAILALAESILGMSPAARMHSALADLHGLGRFQSTRIHGARMVCQTESGIPMIMPKPSDG